MKEYNIEERKDGSYIRHRGDSISYKLSSFGEYMCEENKLLKAENQRMREAIENVLKGNCTTKEVYERFKALEEALKEEA